MSNVTETPVVKPVTAAEILKENHPLHDTFILSLAEGVQPTKRQARKFLAANPAYRVPKQA